MVLDRPGVALRPVAAQWRCCCALVMRPVFEITRSSPLMRAMRRVQLEAKTSEVNEAAEALRQLTGDLRRTESALQERDAALQAAERAAGRLRTEASERMAELQAKHRLCRDAEAQLRAERERCAPAVCMALSDTNCYNGVVRASRSRVHETRPRV